MEVGLLTNPLTRFAGKLNFEWLAPAPLSHFYYEERPNTVSQASGVLDVIKVQAVLPE